MIHRTEKDPNFLITKPFDVNLPPESCNALHTSLIEIKVLQRHYIKEVSEFAKEIERNYRTTSSNPREATPLDVEKYIDRNYRDMIQSQLKAKKHFALADQAPKDRKYIQKGFIKQFFQNHNSSSVESTNDT